MATTIGRVEFVANLNGDNVPKQARALGKKMERAGKDSGDGYAKGLDSSIDRTMTKLGKRIETKLGDSGKLAGERFGTTLDKATQASFRRMQSNLANILTDKGAFAKFADGFVDVSQATKQLDNDITALQEATYKQADAQGKLHDKNVLSWADAQNLRKGLVDLGAEYEANAERTRSLAEETDRTNAAYARLVRSVGDADLFLKKSEQGIGGTSRAYKTLRSELEGSALVLGKSTTELEKHLDTLEKTKNTVEKMNRAEREASRERVKSADGTNKLARAIDKLDHGMTRLGQSMKTPWENLDDDIKLVVGLIASAADQVGALGSALGAGLFGVGAAATAAVVGIGGVIAVFKTLNDDILDLPPSMRNVVREFSAFKGVLTETRKVVAGAAFAEMDGVFTSLGKTMKGLQPAFSKLGTEIGKIGKKFAMNVAPGTEAFELLEKTINNSTPLFGKMADVIGKFGVSLLRAFDGAMPLAEDLVDWVGRLVDTFDRFTRSDSFGTWVSNAQRIFKSLGGVLDATGKMLDDLVTEDSVKRTTDLLDNLAGLVPVLGKILEVFSSLAPLGLLVQLLNEAGKAIEPLLDSLIDLAEILGEGISTAISGFAGVLGGVGAAVAPVVDALTNLLGLITPEVWETAGAAIAIFAGALLALKGAKALGGLATMIDNGILGLTKFGKAGETAALGLAGLGGKKIVGGIVAIVAGLALATSAVNSFSGNIEKVAGSLKGLKSAETIFKDLGLFAAEGSAAMTAKIEGVGDALDRLKRGDKVNTKDWFNTDGFDDMVKDIDHIGEAFGEIAKDDLPAASAAFNNFSKETKLTTEQQSELLDRSKEYKKILSDQITGLGFAASESNLLAAATGKVDFEQKAAEISAQKQADALGELEGKAGASREEIDQLADAIKNFGSAQFDTREATRQLNDSMREFAEDLVEHGSSFDTATGKFNTLTEAGSNQEAMLDDVAQSTLDSAAATLIQTGNLQQANDEYNRGRDALIAMLGPLMGGTEAAEAYVNQLGLTPDSLSTLVETPGMQQALADAGLYIDELGNVVPLVSTTVEAPGVEDATGKVAELKAQFDALPPEAKTESVVTNYEQSILRAEAVDKATGVLEKTVNTDVTQTGADGVVAAAGKVEGAVDAIPDTDKVALSEAGSSTVIAAAGKVEAAVDKIPDTDKVAFSESGASGVITNAEKIKTAVEKIPNTWSVSISLTGAKTAIDAAGDVEYAISKIKSKTVTITTNYVSSGEKKTATGGIFAGAQSRIIGEAGPEAVVPLNRALSRVDPSVRWLSAIAQGKQPTQPMASGGVGGSGRTINIEAGAIQVNGGPDPRRTAQEVVNRITEKAVG